LETLSDDINPFSFLEASRIHCPHAAQKEGGSKSEASAGAFQKQFEGRSYLPVILIVITTYDI
jgi:hypothetical protein